MFSNREMATFIWLAILLIFVLPKKDIRKSLLNVATQFLKILKHVFSVIIIFYICFISYLLYSLKILDGDIVKDYIIWILFALIPLIGKVISNYLTIKPLDLFFNSLKFSIIPLFIINEYTLSLWGELIILPIAGLLSGLIVVANSNDKYKITRKPINFLLATIGTIIFVFSVWGFVNNLSDVRQAVFWEKMLIDIIGILLHLPLLLCVQVFCFYEQILIRTRFSSK